MTHIHALPNPFVTEPFVLDVDRFMADIEPPPVFLSDPSAEYLTATELMPLVELLNKY